MRYKNGVVRSPLFQTAAHVLRLDDEAGVAETLLEFPILPGRPYGQYPVDLESGANSRQSAIVIEPAIFRRRERSRTVVHVEQHSVEFTCTRSDRDRDI